MANGLPQPPIGLPNNDVPDTEVPLLKAILAAVITGGGGGAVSSVFSRTGAVTAQSGDYSTFYQSLTGTLGLAGFSSITGTLPVANGGLGQNNYNAGQYAGATGVFAQLTNSQATGAAFSIQNLAAAGYTSFVATADTGTNSTNFGEFGINNSSWPGSGSINTPLATYLTATGGILVLGTTGANAINFVVNSTVECGNFSATGVLTILNSPRITGSSTGYTALTSANAGASNYTLTIPAVTDTLAVLGTAQTFSGALTFSAAGAASTPTLLLSGASYSGGTGTTTVPQLYINGGTTAPSDFSTNGTLIGMNAKSGFSSGNFIMGEVNGGGVLFSVNAIGIYSGTGYNVSTGSCAMSGLYNSNGFVASNSALIGFSSSGSVTYNSAFDTAFSRVSAKVVALGNGTALDTTGQLRTTFVAAGTAPTCTGATMGTGSKNNSGFVTSTTTGTTTCVVTFPVTAPTAWNIYAVDQTTGTVLPQTASSTTTATFAGTTVSADKIIYIAMPY